MNVGSASRTGDTEANDWASQWAEQIRQEVTVQPDRRFSWDQISQLLGALRTKFGNYAWRTVAKPRARAYPTGATSRVRLYYLIANDFLGQTLWCVDLDQSSASANLAEDSSGPANFRLVNLATIKSQLITGATSVSSRTAVPSKDEELLQERRRSYSTGITDYDLDPRTGTLAFAHQNFVCHFVDGLSAGETGECQPYGVQVPHSPLNLALCPANPMVAAYAAERSVFCVHLLTGQVVQAYDLPAGGHIAAGLPPFAVQEEFDRFHGFWWRPLASSASASSVPSASESSQSSASESSHSQQRLDLAVEVVDESAVSSISIVDPLKAGLEVDSFAYPRAGTPNAVSSLVLVAVFVDRQSESLSCHSPDEPLGGELGSLAPCEDREYLVRVDWSPGGELLLGQTMNRTQDRLRLFAYRPETDATVCLMEEAAPPGRWIEVHDLLKVLTASDGKVTFLWASDETGFRHLYHATATWGPGDRVATCLRRQLTQGSWQVQPDHLAVDTDRQLVYFNSTALDARAVQLCRVGYGCQLQQAQLVPQILTGAYNGFSGHRLAGPLPKTCNGLAFPGEGLALLTVHCSSHSPMVRVCRLEELEAADASYLPTLTSLTTAIECDNFFLEPEYFEFQGPGGQTLYGLLFKPFDYVIGQQYPTIQYIYGGPHVQLVNNTFVGYSFHRVTKACYFGFCVLIVDNRGSDNRGSEFAAEIRHRLGLLELPDQVAGLQFAATKFACIDLNRVALFGWSYGGYLTLVGMRDYNDVYRLGVSGAPVTEWELYDTAYTERYMGMPDGPGGRYEKASAIGAAVGNYPSEANRLLIVHGSIDENVHFFHTAKLLDRLSGARRPYSLLIYPSERHGLRNAASKEHFEISLMHFLCQNL